MDEPGEGSSEPVFYGPPKPPAMIEAERLAQLEAEEEAIMLEEDALVAAGQYCRCTYDSRGEMGPPDSDSEDCPFHDWFLIAPAGQPLPQEAVQNDDDREYETANAEPLQLGSEQRHTAPAFQELQAELDEEDSGDEHIPGGPGQGAEVEDETVEEDDGNDGDDDDNAANEPGRTVVDVSAFGGLGGGITREQLIALLQTQNLADVFDFADSDDSSVEEVMPHRRRPRRQLPPPPPVKPTVEGMKLQRSGAFGANEISRRSRKNHMRRILEREHGLGSLEDRSRNSGLLTQEMIPETRAEHILHYDEPVYSGQFSEDGNFYYSVCQDFKVRMYDTSNPFDWKHYKTVSYPWGSWTLTDASLSPDNKWLVYASHSALVSIAPTDPLDKGDPYTLNLEGGSHGRDVEIANRMNFSIFSIRFSGDGRELVAGTRQNTIVLYDIEKRQVMHTIEAHENDVNAVCFGDKDEPHLIYSGSDDGVLKVWDRRSLNDTREAGAFVGHKGGLTYIDSKNDGRYVLSNGKDQTAKLWDVRMAYSSMQFHIGDMAQYTRYSEYDYRYMDDMDLDYTPHPKDNSVVTFRGHKVQRTLIRCHFAPPGSANSRYVYSGSSDGKVHVWNIDSTVAKVIDVAKATKGTRRNDGRRRYFAFDDDQGDWEACVRDVSWHPHAPVMAASAWNSFNMSRGTTSVHSFTDAHGDEDDLPMGRSYNAMMERQEGLYDMQYD